MTPHFCTNGSCQHSAKPHRHESNSIDSPILPSPWPERTRWQPPKRYNGFGKLLSFGWFSSHSKFQLPWKINCAALDADEIAAIASIIRWKFAFSAVYGIPRGGLALAKALEPYCDPGYPTLIVDDVLTTGRSMEAALQHHPDNSIGVVIFARGKCPSWVWPIFTVNEWAQSRATGLG